MATTPDRAHGLFEVSSSGTGDARLIVKAPRLVGGNPAWSPDGRFLVYAAGDTGNEALWIISTEAGATPRRLLENATQPAISPDGRLLAYASATTDRAEVYVTTFPDPGQVWPVSGDGGRYPRWSPRGGELFFVSGANVDDDPAYGSELSAVKINTLGAVTVGAPEVLFNAVSLGFRLNVQASRVYDVGPDGQRFLVQSSGREGTPTITAIQNLRAWMARPH